MKRSLVYLFIVACAVAGIWGYAYELAYFLVLKLNVHDTLTIQHFVASGLLNVLPLLGIVLVYSLIAKFLSPNLTRDELNHFQEEMKKSKFAQQASIARMSFVMSVAYLLLVAFDVRVYADMSLAYLFWLLIFINMQSFVGAIYLSPSQSRVPVIFAFVLSVGLCFAAGGLGLAKDSSRSSTTIRDDFIVKIERRGNILVAAAKPVKIPFFARLQALWQGT